MIEQEKEPQRTTTATRPSPIKRKSFSPSTYEQSLTYFYKGFDTGRPKPPPSHMSEKFFFLVFSSALQPCDLYGATNSEIYAIKKELTKLVWLFNNNSSSRRGSHQETRKSVKREEKSTFIARCILISSDVERRRIRYWERKISSFSPKNCFQWKREKFLRDSDNRFSSPLQSQNLFFLKHHRHCVFLLLLARLFRPMPITMMRQIVLLRLNRNRRRRRNVIDRLLKSQLCRK